MVLDYIRINGGSAISGTVNVSGAKNAVLPLIFATLLTKERCILTNVPDLDDVGTSCELLESLGAHARLSKGRLSIKALSLSSDEASYSLIKRLRASFWILGPLLGREGHARVALPGGDAIGTRPVDLHLAGLSKMGAQFYIEQGVVLAEAPGGLRPANIKLDYPSVGATHNIMMAAALTPGVTTIDGAAREPEIIALANFLCRMGAKIYGAGTDSVSVEGAHELSGATMEVIGDRVEAATYLIAAAATGGEVLVTGISPESLSGVLETLEQMGARIELAEQEIRLAGPERLVATQFQTAPFPGFATDVQPIMMAALTLAEGSSRVEETVFENRFGHVAEYRRFGAEIEVVQRSALINGVERLSGAPVEARDIRAAAGLVVMGLAAKGQTEIHQIYHLDRGYDSMVSKLQGLGAEISREPETEKRELVIGC